MQRYNQQRKMSAEKACRDIADTEKLQRHWKPDNKEKCIHCNHSVQTCVRRKLVWEAELAHEVPLLASDQFFTRQVVPIRKCHTEGQAQ